jgi:hypothetical protein
LNGFAVDSAAPRLAASELAPLYYQLARLRGAMSDTNVLSSSAAGGAAAPGAPLLLIGPSLEPHVAVVGTPTLDYVEEFANAAEVARWRREARRTASPGAASTAGARGVARQSRVVDAVAYRAFAQVLEHSVLSSRSADALARIAGESVAQARDAFGERGYGAAAALRPVFATQLDAWRLGGAPRPHGAPMPSATFGGALWALTALGGAARAGVASVAMGDLFVDSQFTPVDAAPRASGERAEPPRDVTSALAFWNATLGAAQVRPRFWALWFWRRLMGRVALPTRVKLGAESAAREQQRVGGALCAGVESSWEAATASSRCLRIYAHCLPQQPGIGVLVLSLSRSSVFRLRISAWLADIVAAAAGSAAGVDSPPAGARAAAEPYLVDSWTLRGGRARGLRSAAAFANGWALPMLTTAAGAGGLLGAESDAAFLERLLADSGDEDAAWHGGDAVQGRHSRRTAAHALRPKGERGAAAIEALRRLTVDILPGQALFLRIRADSWPALSRCA